MWFRQTPLLAVIVFGIGVSLGLAWKAGVIPVELGEANTGSLSESDLAPLNDELVPAPTPPPAVVSNDLLDIAAQTEPDPTDVLPETQPGPSARPLLLAADPKARQITRPEPPAAVRATEGPATDEPEWATAGRNPNSSHHPVAQIVPRSNPTNSVPPRSREIQLASNQLTDSEQVAPVEQEATPIDNELKEIDDKIASQDFLAAHRALSKLYWNHRESRGALLKRLHQTSRVIFFEPQPHFVEPYVVQANDRLSSIAGKYQLTWEYLAKLNRTEPRRIQPGQKLKILKGPFSAVVDLGDFALTIHLQGYFVKRYEVGIGKDGASPLGKFAVINKVENPQYTGPDGKVIPGDSPLNPLGERWIDLGDSYGIHGTIEPDSIGKAASRGCIRMREKDVIEVYDFLVKGSEVTIRR